MSSGDPLKDTAGSTFGKADNVHHSRMRIVSQVFRISVKTLNTYRTIGMYTNCACLFQANEQESRSEVAASPDNSLFAGALSCMHRFVCKGQSR